MEFEIFTHRIVHITFCYLPNLDLPDQMEHYKLVKHGIVAPLENLCGSILSALHCCTTWR